MTTSPHARSSILQILRLTAPATPDADLLTRYANCQDQAAFTELVGRHGPTVFGVCRRMLRNAADAEDAFQAVFLALARHAGKVRNRSSVAAWLYGAAYRVCLNVRRARVRSCTALLPADDAPSIGDPLECVSAREFLGILDEELAALPARHRLPVLLCLVEGLSHAEAAARLGWTPGSVKGRLERGRARLRRRLAARGLAPVAALGLALAPRPGAVPAALLARAVEAGRGGAAPAAVAALAGVAVRAGVSAARTAALMFAAIAAAAVALGQPASPAPVQKAEAGPPARTIPVAAAAPARTDRFGDPLPEGAVLRLGTVGFRAADLVGVGFRPSGELVGFNEQLDLYVWPADGSPRPKITNVAGKPQFGWRRAISPDGRFAAGLVGQRLVVWNTTAGEPAEHLSRDVQDIYTMAFSPDGAWLAINHHPAQAGALLLCNLAAKTWRELPLAGTSAEAISFTPDGKSLAVTTHGDVRVYDTASGTQRLRTVIPKCALRFAALSPDGETLAVLPVTFIHDSDPTVRILSVKSGKPVDGMKPPAATARWVGFTPDGKSLLLGSVSGIREWDPAAGKWVREIPGPAEHPPVYSPDRERLASNARSAVLLWDIPHQRGVRPDLVDAGHTQSVLGVTLSPDGRFIATDSFDSDIRVWDTATGRSLCRVRSAWGFDGRVAFLPDSKSFIAVADDRVTPVVWDAATGREVRRFVVPAELVRSETTHELCLSADGKTLTTTATPVTAGGQGHKVRWDVGTGRPIERVATANTRLPFKRHVVSPDGRWAFTRGKLSRVGAEGPIQPALVVPGEFDLLSTAKFSDDSHLLAASRATPGPSGQTPVGASVVVFDLTTLAPAVELPAGDGLGLAFDPGARHLAVMGPDDISLWELASAKPACRFRAPHRTNMFQDRTMAFTPDGRRLVTGHGDSTALVWDLTGTGRAAGDPAPPLSAANLDRLWEALAGADAAAAHVAGWELADRPGPALALLRDRLKPAQPADEAVVRSLVEKLDSRSFAEREAAEKRLGELGELAAPALRALQKEGLSAEQTKRVERLLAAASERPLPSGERLRQVRAVAVLERVGGADARKQLEGLAGGVAEARVTREAKESLERLAQRVGERP